MEGISEICKGISEGNLEGISGKISAWTTESNNAKNSGGLTARFPQISTHTPSRIFNAIPTDNSDQISDEIHEEILVKISSEISGWFSEKKKHTLDWKNI